MNYRIFLIVAVMLSMGFVKAAFAQTLPQLKVLTLNFNSEDVFNDSNEAVRDIRFHGLVNWVHANDPDVILLQEAWSYRGEPSVALTLAKALGYDVAYRLDMGFPGIYYDSDAVLTKKDLQMSHENDLKLPHSAVEKGDGKTWIVELGVVSYAVGVQTTLSNGDQLFIYSTHLVGSTESDRKDQLLAIDQDVQKQISDQNLSAEHTHIIIGGDLNSNPSDGGPVGLKQNSYRDSFNEAHPADPSCSFCGDINIPYFNPITLGAGQFPSQSDETDSGRYDYIFYKSAKLKTLSSSFVFTLPWEGIWMSDHYGVFTVLADKSSDVSQAPAHDYNEGPTAAVFSVTNSLMDCHTSSSTCQKLLPPQRVSGARGFVIQNQSSTRIHIKIRGPGVIMTHSEAQIGPHRSVAFTFLQKGNFTYQIYTTNGDVIEKNFGGNIQVVESGY